MTAPASSAKYRVAELGDGQRDDPGAALAQVAGGEVRAVAEFVDGPLDLGPHTGCDVLIVVDDVRHGLDGHARTLRNVLETDAHGTPSFVTLLGCCSGETAAGTVPWAQVDLRPRAR
ncbi:hypothetical protein Sgou_19120 [Streptomyces gougerotii]|uniref:Resolvase/invertase-type recombinase catalytic domain-containing protein n=1 Tax=Streptomyces gougerotii TaxID=53448 RepID=A0ABQ1D3V6_9ACTN|nr:hypothetical protein Sgou_19120 [Streptomyces gougerotii]